MTLYNRFILPRVIDLAMKNKEVTRLRAKAIPRAAGIVLEVGIGSGLNLPFYTSTVTKLYGIDPSAELLKMAQSRAATVSFPVELLNRPADRIPLHDAAVDTIVVTWSLCSVADPLCALKEMRRILKPAGMVIFVEHGLAPDDGVRAWQHRLTPLWRRIAGGCHLNRKVDSLLRDARFSVDELHTGYIPGPRILTYTYDGIGRKS